MKKYQKLIDYPITKKCKECNNIFKRPKDYGNISWINRKYCSQNCVHKSIEYQKNRAIKISIAQKGRKVSEKTKKAISIARKGIKFTKEHCENISKGTKGKVAWNKNKKSLFPAWNKGKSNIWAIGDKNCNWKGGISNKNNKIRESIEYKYWRKSVFERDKYTCQNCNQKGGRLEADHIKPFCKFIELRFDINNGRTLCKKCHKELGWNYFKDKYNK